MNLPGAQQVILPDLLHQHLCLYVDTTTRSLQGYTELKLKVQAKTQIIGLHAYKLNIKSVRVNGELADFDVRTHLPYELPDSYTKGPIGRPRPDAPDPGADIADLAYYNYNAQILDESKAQLQIQIPACCLPVGDAPTPAPASRPPSAEPAAAELVVTPESTAAPPTEPSPGNPQTGGSSAEKEVGSATGAEKALVVNQQQQDEQGLGQGQGQSAAPAAGKPRQVNGSGSKKEVPEALELTVRVEYEVKDPQCGVHFSSHHAHTCSQVRRACAWFPCIDVPEKRSAPAEAPARACPFTMDVTVAADEMAVCGGELLRQTWAEGGQRKTFHYVQQLATPAQHIAMAVGRMQVVPGPALPQLRPAHQSLDGGPPEGGPAAPSAAVPREGGAPETVLTHFAPAGLPAADLEATVKFMPLPFTFFEEFLGAKFPYASLQQVFVDAEAAREQLQPGAGIQLVASDLLLRDGTVEQAMEARVALARGLACHWFGVFMRPARPSDQWLVAGLVGYLEDQYVAKFMGRNEAAYRRYKQREAVYLADDGLAPPLVVTAKEDPSGWGPLHSTEQYDPSGLRYWKATAVIHMLERRANAVTEGSFRRLLQGLVLAATQQQHRGKGGGGRGGPDPPDGKRLLTTGEFVREVGKAGGFRKEVKPFADRWILGQGCPRITAALSFQRKKGVVEVAFRQEANEAARRGSERALRGAPTGSTIGNLKLTLRERLDERNNGVNNEQELFVGDRALDVKEVRLSVKAVKKGAAKPRGRKGAAAADDEPPDSLLGPGSDALSVMWFRLDPGAETLCCVRALQSEAQWAAQLELSRDPVAQAQAVAGLAAQRPTTHGALATLQRCMENDKMFCRVRIQAAAALASTADASNGWAGLHMLLRFFRARVLDPASGYPRPNCFADVAEHMLTQSLPLAMAGVRVEGGVSPSEVVETLLAAAKHNDNRGNPLDDSNWRAALLEALGHTHPPTPKVLRSVVRLLEQQLAREAVVPSYQAAVGCAALAALARLAVALADSRPSAGRLQPLVAQYTSPDTPLQLRLTAHCCAARLSCVAAGLDAALGRALDAAADEAAPPLIRCGVLEDALQLVREVDDGEAPWGAPAVARDVGIPLRLRTHGLMTGAADMRLRHLAFMLLMRLGGAPATLFREQAQQEASGPSATGGPERSLDTMRRTTARPAASGPAFSLDSREPTARPSARPAGTAKLKLKHGGGASRGGDGRTEVSGLLRVMSRENLEGEAVSSLLPTAPTEPSAAAAEAAASQPRLLPEAPAAHAPQTSAAPASELQPGRAATPPPTKRARTAGASQPKTAQEAEQVLELLDPGLLAAMKSGAAGGQTKRKAGGGGGGRAMADLAARAAVAAVGGVFQAPQSRSSSPSVYVPSIKKQPPSQRPSPAPEATSRLGPGGESGDRARPGSAPIEGAAAAQQQPSRASAPPLGAPKQEGGQPLPVFHRYESIEPELDWLEEGKRAATQGGTAAAPPPPAQPAAVQPSGQPMAHPAGPRGYSPAPQQPLPAAAQRGPPPGVAPSLKAAPASRSASPYPAGRSEHGTPAPEAGPAAPAAAERKPRLKFRVSGSAVQTPGGPATVPLASIPTPGTAISGAYATPGQAPGSVPNPGHRATPVPTGFAAADGPPGLRSTGGAVPTRMGPGGPGGTPLTAAPSSGKLKLRFKGAGALGASRAATPQPQPQPAAAAQPVGPAAAAAEGPQEYLAHPEGAAPYGTAVEAADPGGKRKREETEEERAERKRAKRERKDKKKAKKEKGREASQQQS